MRINKTRLIICNTRLCHPLTPMSGWSIRPRISCSSAAPTDVTWFAFVAAEFVNPIVAYRRHSMSPLVMRASCSGGDGAPSPNTSFWLAPCAAMFETPVATKRRQSTSADDMPAIRGSRRQIELSWVRTNTPLTSWRGRDTTAAVRGAGRGSRRATQHRVGFEAVT